LEKYYKEKARKLTAGLIKESLDSWIAKVSIPKKKSAYVRMQDALSSGVPLEKVVKEFGWLKSRDGFTDFYTAAELEEIKRNYKEPKLIEEKVPEELKELVEELKELNFFRTDRTDKNYEFLGEARPILEEAAKTIGVTFKELAFFDANSVIEGKPNRIGVPFCYLYVNGRQVLQKEPFFDFGKDKSKEVKGVVAYKGLVRGIVKIVRHPSEIEKVQKDDILVSQMTFPSFIAAMQKAAAFVTDEGSITCHAAIVAREMKKPCIIGTKNATKVLKDGDYVEVDANKGVVTILSKEKK
jgi:phosphohistidine swiveling domain-containing protein